MDHTELQLRNASDDDVEPLADIIEEVSDGIVSELFDDVFPGMSSKEILRLVIGKNVTPYSLDNMVIAEVNGEIAGLLFAYPGSQQVIPELMHAFIAAEKIQSVKGLLTAGTASDLWVNTLWVAPRYRGQGLSELLINYAVNWAAHLELQGVALHCWADNTRAKAFYFKHNFRQYDAISFGLALMDRHPSGGLLLRREI